MATLFNPTIAMSPEDRALFSQLLDPRCAELVRLFISLSPQERAGVLTKARSLGMLSSPTTEKFSVN